jgi:1-phosphofructokinase
LVYTITLNPALDYVLNLKSIRTDDINRATSEEIYFGGKGINVSAILSRLGVENKALGFVAGFTGKKLEEMLKQEGIICDFNFLDTGNTRINVKIKADYELDVNANGPDVSEKDIDALLEKLNEIKAGDYLILAGSIPKNLPNDIYERILKSLSDRGVNFVIDAEKDLLLNALKYKPFLIKPNHHELGDMFGVKTESDEEISKYSKLLQQQGAKNVLVSRAKKGAMLIDEYGNSHKIGNIEGKLVNSVGCGDSMVAGFIAGYLEKGDYQYALTLGSACGNATAFSKELATKEEIVAVLNKYIS